jgi:hypothetical protein
MMLKYIKKAEKNNDVFEEVKILEMTEVQNKTLHQQRRYNLDNCAPNLGIERI